MSKAGARKKAERKASGGSIWDRFNRELEEINATLARLEQSIAPMAGHDSDAPAKSRARLKARRAERTNDSPPMAAATSASPVTEVEPTAAASASAAVPAAPPPSGSPGPAVPTGTDLGDPKNFGLMPPTADLEPGALSPEEHRKRLAAHLAFANRVLHTSRVPAAVWREWRAFEKAAHERLRAL